LALIAPSKMQKTPAEDIRAGAALPRAGWSDAHIQPGRQMERSLDQDKKKVHGFTSFVGPQKRGDWQEGGGL